MIMIDTLKSLVPKLANHKIMVLGDVILDEYIRGKAERMSREAPIPVLEMQSKQYIPGGAANPSANIVALGSEVLQVGIVGADDVAETLRSALNQRSIDTAGLVIADDRPTTLKTRILAQMGLRFPQQVARIDTLSREPINGNIEAKIKQQIENNISQNTAVIVSDYHNGLLTPQIIHHLRENAQRHDVPLFVDAQGALEKYKAFDVVKCNADDAETYLNRTLKTNADFAEAATQLSEKLAVCQAMIITRGAQGATVAPVGDDVVHCASPRVADVYDTVGAGDTAIAVTTLACVAGAHIRDAVMLANYASGIVVKHVGNYAPSPEDLLKALDNHR